MDVHNCALYGRVSTVRQALVQEGGLDTQFDLMDRFVSFENSKAAGKWQVHDHYREEAFSGKNLERPEFRRMMRDIEAGEVNTVIVQKIDRITRSLRDFFQLWEVFEAHDVHFISLHEKFDTTTAVGRAMLKLILVFAELEREQTGERTKATMEHRARQGLWNGGRVPGYDLDPARRGVLIVNPREAETVREHFFRKCLELGSAGKIVPHLRQIGIQKPVYQSRQGKQRGGGFYSKMEVLRVLTNPVYLGKVRFQGAVYDGQHEQIVQEDLFNDVQRVLARNRERRGNYHDQRTHVFLLQGLLRCGQCGSMMTPKTSIGRNGKSHFYYQCTRNNHSVGTGCQAKYVPAEGAEDFVLAELRKWVISPQEIEAIVREANDQKDDRIEGLEKELKALRGQLKAVQGRIDPLVRAVEERADLRSLTDRLDELEAERKSIEDEIASVELEIDLIRQHTMSVEVMADTWRDFPAMLDHLRQAEEADAVRDLLGRYIEVVDWHQDTKDPTAGTAVVMLFEQTQPDRADGEQKTLDAAAVNQRCVESNEWLPD